MSANPAETAGRIDRTAEAVSLWGSPPVLGTLFFAGVGWIEGPKGLLQTLLAWVLMILLPTLLLLAKVHRGSITSTDMSDLSERRRFLPLILLLAAVTALAALRLDFPTPLQASIVAMVFWLSASTAVSQVWRVSLHVSSAVGFVWLSVALFGAPALLFAVLPPAIAWSRLHLHRHDLWQVVGGAVLGSFCALAAVMLLLH